MRGVFLDAGSMALTSLDLSALDDGPVAWSYYESTALGDVGGRIETADIVITNKVVLDENTLRSAKQLKLICVAATGFNNIDLAAAKRMGVTVCNVRGYATPSVVEHVFALLLALMRHLPDYQRDVQAGRWQKSTHFSFIDYPILELHGKVMGIIGYGELGQAVARVAEVFGMRVMIAEHSGMTPRTGRTALPELLSQVDVLTLHCPLTDETRGLIGAKELRQMKRGAVLINTSRGGIVDELALLESLRTRHLGGAGVDVLGQEPPIDSPLLSTDIPNIIVTPHIAWASRESRQRLLNELATNVAMYLRGTPRNVIP